MKNTQSILLLQHLRRNGPITQLEALRQYGIGRLAARIYDLKRHGVDVARRQKTVQKANGDTTVVAEYYLPVGQGVLF